MFKEDYSSANNSIHADKELIDKILSINNKRKRPVIYKVVPTVAAAAVIISASFVAMPHLMNNNDNGIIYEKKAAYISDAEDTEDVPVVSSAKPQITAKPKQRQNAVPAQPQKTARPQITAVPPDGYNTKTESANVYNSTTPIPQTQPQNSAVPKQSANESYSFKNDIPDENSAPVIDASPRSLVLSVNSVQHIPELSAFNTEGIYLSAASLADKYTYADWSIDEYFSYLGRRINDISLPQDFRYTGSSEFTFTMDSNNNPSNDKAIFPYDGENGRYINIITSKNTSDVHVRLQDQSYSQSDIYGTPAVVLLCGSTYKCYIIYDSISYIITADGISEDELKEILTNLCNQN